MTLTLQWKNFGGFHFPLQNWFQWQVHAMPTGNSNKQFGCLSARGSRRDYYLPTTRRGAEYRPPMLTKQKI